MQSRCAPSAATAPSQGSWALVPGCLRSLKVAAPSRTPPAVPPGWSGAWRCATLQHRRNLTRECVKAIQQLLGAVLCQQGFIAIEPGFAIDLGHGVHLMSERSETRGERVERDEKNGCSGMWS